MKRKPPFTKHSKYGSRRTLYNGIWYHSALEVRFAKWLDLRCRPGGDVILWDAQHELMLKAYSPQPQMIAGKRRFWRKRGVYRADFRVLFRDHREEIWDVKAWDKKQKKIRTTPLFNFKWGMVQINYPDTTFRIMTEQDLPKLIK